MKNGLTRFFRNRAQLKTFEHYAVPRIIKTKTHDGSRVLRIWSAGCSTGEEPYTIAMLCSELLPPDYSFVITATDSNVNALAVAEAGSYTLRETSDVPARYLQKYFVSVPGGYRVNDSLRETVTFIRRDLTTASVLTRQDVVFLRNVTLYYDRENRKKILNQVLKSMDFESYLFIGDSESLFDLDTGLDFVHTEWSPLFKKTRASL
jgi:chemotaxis protein methyltransferase CheR